MGKEYLIIYDVRGIQKYIFRSRKIKEISGASNIVTNQLKALLCNVLETKGLKAIDFKLWKNANNFNFMKDKNILCEVVYEGGGNLVLAYRTASNDDEMSINEIIEFNSKLQLLFQKNTYSLSLAYAFVPMTHSFNEDLIKLKTKLSNVKERMPQLVVSPANPLTSIDPYTSQVISEFKLNNGTILSDSTHESYLKFIQYNDINLNCGETLVDEIAKSQSDKSNKTMIGIVHIDGNNIGNMIVRFKTKFIQDIEQNQYENEIRISREISKKISDTFDINFETIIKKIKEENNLLKEEKILYRTIINSGDDITFMCKAEYAIELSRKIMVEIENKEFSQKDYFSSCCGIAFVHSHFPFHIAYEIAEECCSRAKEKAHDYTSNRLNIDKSKNNILSFLDYEIVSSGIIESLDSLYKHNKGLYMKPYCVTEKYINEFPNNCNKNYFHINKLYNNVKIISQISRSNAKELRNNYQISKNDAEFTFERIKIKNNMLYNLNAYNNNFAEFYDACSLLDIISKPNKEVKD